MKVSRYACQNALAELGPDSQKKISASSVAVVGVGALGSHASEILCRMGVGQIALIDFDIIDLKNLHRQTLYTEEDVGRAKARAASEKLSRINSEVELSWKAEMLKDENSDELLSGHDLILDCTDNLETRRAINRWALRAKKPWVHAACVKTKGTLLSVLPGGPCFECVFPKKTASDSCSSAGILPGTAAVVAALQVSEALKILLGKKHNSVLVRIDAWNYEFEKFSVKKNSLCPACSGWRGSSKT